MNAPLRHAALPPTLAPRGLSRVEAAAYIGVSAGKFDDMVADGRMPKPKLIDARKVWDIRALDAAFSALPDQDGAPVGGVENEWDVVLKPKH